ncbi:MAG TPA: hypothetical protein VKT77_09595 [Chthonomonadaceae bacterium]|nr:hypothetical protein [Chthonomonadaceae bacterium]
MSSGSRGDILGRAVGLMVFLVGIALLVIVFTTAFRLFNSSPEAVLNLRFTGDPKRDPLLSAIGVHFGWIFLQIAFLVVMSLAASFISQRGINLYFSAMQGSPILPRPAAAPAIESEARGQTGPV